MIIQRKVFGCKTVPLLIASLAALVLALSAWADPTLFQTKKGETCVELDEDFTELLESKDIAVGTISPANTKNGEVCFPIVGGAIDLGDLSGEIFHSGGLTLTQGETIVELTSFIIDTTDNDSSVLTGLVVADGDLAGRVPLFDLRLENVEVNQKGKKLTISDVILTLTDTAAKALNDIFEGAALTEGALVGNADVSVMFYRSDNGHRHDDDSDRRHDDDSDHGHDDDSDHRHDDDSDHGHDDDSDHGHDDDSDHGHDDDSDHGHGRGRE